MPSSRASRNLLLLTLSFSICQPGFGQKEPPTPAKAYPVYNALFNIMRMPKTDARIVIANATLNDKCGQDTGNQALVKGCGLWSAPQTEDSTHAEIQQKWPQLQASTWTDFATKSHTGTRLHDAELKSSWQHQSRNLFVTSPTDWKSPDGIILLSSAGFNTEKNQAIVYVLFLSYVDPEPTSGTYFLLQLDPSKQWQVTGRITAMKTTR